MCSFPVEKKTGIQVSRVPLLDSSKVLSVWNCVNCGSLHCRIFNSLNSTFGSGSELNNVRKGIMS